MLIAIQLWAVGKGCLKGGFEGGRGGDKGNEISSPAQVVRTNCAHSFKPLAQRECVQVYPVL